MKYEPKEQKVGRGIYLVLDGQCIPPSERTPEPSGSSEGLQRDFRGVFRAF